MKVKLPKELPRGAAAAADADRRQVPGPPHARGRGHVRREARARVTTAADLRPLLLSPEDGGRARRARHEGRRRARAALPRQRRAPRRLHQAARRPEAPRGRDLVPRRPPGLPRRGPADDRAARGRGGDRAGAGRRRAGRSARAGRHVRDELQDPPVRRRDQAGARVDAAADRGRGGARAVAAGPVARVRAPAADPQGRAVQDAHLHGRAATSSGAPPRGSSSTSSGGSTPL